MLFSDNFNRADGPLGANWTVEAGAPSIASNRCVLGSNGAAHPTDVSITGDGYAQCVVYNPAGWSGTVYLDIKRNTGLGRAYYIGVTCQNGAVLCALVRVTSQGTSNTGWNNVAVGVMNDFTARIEYLGGNVIVSINNTEVYNIADNYNAAYSELRLSTGLGGCTVDNYAAGDTITRSMEVTPDPLWVGGGQTLMTATGTNTTWTPGTPGSSTITADHGTIDEQWTPSGTQIKFFYTPSEYIGPIVFTESEYSLQDTINSTALPPGGGGGAGQFSPEAVAYIERSAVAQNDPTILNEEAPTALDGAFGTARGTLGAFYRQLAKIVDPEGEPPEGSRFLSGIWDMISWRTVLQPGEFTMDVTKPLKADTYELLAALTLLQAAPHDTLNKVVDTIMNGPGMSIDAINHYIGVPEEGSFSNLYSFLVDISNGDINSLSHIEFLLSQLPQESGATEAQVQAIVEAARGTGLPTIKSILDKLNANVGEQWTELDAIWHHALMADTHSSNNYDILYNLTDNNTKDINTILNAIANIPTGGNEDVLAALATLVGVPTTTLAAILAKINEVRGDGTTTLKAILEAAQADPNNPNYTIPALLAILMAALMGAPTVVAALTTKLAGGKLDLILDILEVLIDGADFFHTLWDHFNPQSASYSPITVPPYPGLDRVTLLDPVPFVDGVNLSLRMDGALIDIATPGEHPYAIKNTNPTRYGRLGTFAFAADVGRLEAIQPIQYLNFVATPRAIALPTGIVVQCKSGTVGTVVPYTIS